VIRSRSRAATLAWIFSRRATSCMAQKLRAVYAAVNRKLSDQLIYLSVTISPGH
jgi:hypothetical protein